MQIAEDVENENKTIKHENSSIKVGVKRIAKNRNKQSDMEFGYHEHSKVLKWRALTKRKRVYRPE